MKAVESMASRVRNSCGEQDHEQESRGFAAHRASKGLVGLWRLHVRDSGLRNVTPWQHLEPQPASPDAGFEFESLTIPCATAKELSRAAHRVLLLDYDGTVAPFTADRSRAVPYAPIPGLLERIMGTCRTSVALISGRPACEIPKLLGLDPHPEIWGSHGLERLYPDGRYEIPEIDHAALESLSSAAKSLENLGLLQASELKPGAVAVHWRWLPARKAEEVRAAAYRILSPLSCNGGLMIESFDGGLELRVRNRNKGDVVRTILSEVSNDLPVAYLGDDVTDEEAFRALSGRGLSVLVRSHYHFSAAQIWLKPPDELVQFLKDWIRLCEGQV